MNLNGNLQTLIMLSVVEMILSITMDSLMDQNYANKSLVLVETLEEFISQKPTTKDNGNAGHNQICRVKIIKISKIPTLD